MALRYLQFDCVIGRSFLSGFIKIGVFYDMVVLLASHLRSVGVIYDIVVLLGVICDLFYSLT
jgi:hypothetical protein